MTLAEDTYRNLVCTLGTLPKREHGRVIAAAAKALGKSSATVYRNIKKLGHNTGRKRRSDAGTSEMTEQEAHAVAQIMAIGVNKRGQVNVPVREARLIAIEQGRLRECIAYESVLRKLNALGLSRRHQLAPEAGVQRRSVHPNHVWFFDISIAIQWYFRDENGKALGQDRHVGGRYYTGKISNFKKLRSVLHRYLVTDHYSGAYFVRYYYQGGERAVDVADFLWHAMGNKGEIYNGVLPDQVTDFSHAFPFRGVPKRLVLDQGSANKSGLIRSLLDGLGVEAEYHAPGNAKASGSVETRHNHWQRTFEGRLALKPADTLEELNVLAAMHCAKVNAERILSRTRRSEEGPRAPMQIWSGISAEQLTEPPSREVFFQLACDLPKTATVTNQHRIRANNRFWEVRGPNIYAGQKLEYRLAPFEEAGIRVWDSEGRELGVIELTFDEVGQATNGRVHTWDDAEQAGASAPPTPGQHIAARLKSGELELEVEDPFEGLAVAIERQAFLAPQQGQPWAGTTATAEEPPMGRMDALEAVALELGSLSDLAPEGRAWWKARIGDGITASDLNTALADWRAGDTTAARTGT